MADLKVFARNIQVRAFKMVENVDALVRRVALAVDTAVVLRTPVDTGRARANWQVNIGSPAVGEVATPGSPDQGSATALTAAQSTIATYKGQGNIHITNNVPYIGKLNEGHSRQAPAGFVEAAVVAGIEAIDTSRGRIV